MGLKESLRELQKKERLSVKREVKKELTKIKKQKKCSVCNVNDARYILKGTNDAYCKECALEHFYELGHLQKIK